MAYFTVKKRSMHLFNSVGFLVELLPLDHTAPVRYISFFTVCGSINIIRERSVILSRRKEIKPLSLLRRERQHSTPFTLLYTLSKHPC